MAYEATLTIGGIITVIVIIIIVWIIVVAIRRAHHDRDDDSLSEVLSDWDERLHDWEGHRRHGGRANRHRWQGGKRQSRKCDCDETPPCRRPERTPIRIIESESCPSSSSSSSSCITDSSSSSSWSTISPRSSSSSEACEPCKRRR